MSLKVRKHQHGIIIEDVFAKEVFLKDLAVRDLPDNVRPFGIHEIHVKVQAPAVVLYEL